MNSHGGMILPGKTEELGDKPLSHTDILSATNPAWIDPGSEPWPPRYEASECLNHGTAIYGYRLEQVIEGRDFFYIQQ
jgi:hypothetical protein